MSETTSPAIRLRTQEYFKLETAQPAPVASYGELEIPSGEAIYGPPDGMTIDMAIETLVRQNLDLYALRLEIPMAEADVLTASLRANPIFYADTQLIPYGHFSFLRVGGPAQTDINLNFPIDVTRKRRARTIVAQRAKKVAEAQLQDAIRTQIDNLYTVYVDVVAAGLTLNFSEAYAKGLKRLLDLNEQLQVGGFIKPADVLAIRAKLEQAQLQIREANQALIKAKQALALILSMPLAGSESLQVRDIYRDIQPLPEPPEALVQKGLAYRPDLAAIRLGIQRAEADVRLARANRYPDVYVVYQPYTLQNNTYLGIPSAYSWTLGVTANVPLYNRNQGNIARAKINLDQTQVQAASTERAVTASILDAIREFDQSNISVQEVEREIVPAAKVVRDSAFQRWQGGEVSALEYLDAQQAYNEVVRTYRDTLIRHRRAMLDLNTALAQRVMP